MENIDSLAVATTIAPEIRFTTKGNVSYVFANSLQSQNVVVKSLGNNSGLKIEKITMLGSSKPIKWKQQNDLITFQMPEKDKSAVMCMC